MNVLKRFAYKLEVFRLLCRLSLCCPLGQVVVKRDAQLTGEVVLELVGPSEG